MGIMDTNNLMIKSVYLFSNIIDILKSMKSEFERRQKPYLFAIFLILILLLAMLIIPYLIGFEPPKMRGLSLRKTLTSSNPRVGALFGWSIALSQNTILVMETGNLLVGDPTGALVYLYDRKTLVLKETFTYPNPREGAYNTFPAAIGESSIVLGEHWADVNGMRDAGRVYVYSSENMELRAILSSPKPEPGGFFGWSIAVGSGVIAISELRGAADNVRKAGKVYFYDEKTLALKAILTSPFPSEWAGFGAAIALAPSFIAISEPWAFVSGKPNSGRVYIYDFNFVLKEILISPDPQQDAVFGYSIAAGSGLVIVGEPKADVGNIRMAGRAHVFEEL